MFESLKTIVSAVKEAAVQTGAKAYINQKIQAFGSVTDLKIDPRLKTIFIEAALKGEVSPIAVTVSNYELSTAPGVAYIVPRRFEASREWLAAALNQYVAGKRFQIPASLCGVF